MYLSKKKKLAPKILALFTGKKVLDLSYDRGWLTQLVSKDKYMEHTYDPREIPSLKKSGYYSVKAIFAGRQPFFALKPFIWHGIYAFGFKKNED